MNSKSDISKKKLPKGITIVPGLDEKHANDPFLLEKDQRAAEFLKKHPLPKELEDRMKKRINH